MSETKSMYEQRPWLNPQEMQLVVEVCLRCLEQRAKSMSLAAKNRIRTGDSQAAA